MTHREAADIGGTDTQPKMIAAYARDFGGESCALTLNNTTSLEEEPRYCRDVARSDPRIRNEFKLTLRVIRGPLMRFWDAAALLPLLIQESATDSVQAIDEG